MNSQNEPFGQEFVISYVLNDYQKGSLVARFDGPPSTAQMKSFLSGYSLEPSSIRDVSARLAPRVSIQAPRSANPTVQSNRAAQAQLEKNPAVRRQQRKQSSPQRKGSGRSVQQRQKENKANAWSGIIFTAFVLFTILFYILFSS